jgi:hypothetical protein
MTTPIHPVPEDRSENELIRRSRFIGSVPEHNADIYWDPIDNSVCLALPKLRWFVVEDDRLRNYSLRKDARMVPTNLPLDLECTVLQLLQDNNLMLPCTNRRFKR